MAKLKVQSFAKIPNEYVSIERSRSLSLLEEKLVYMLINSMQKRWESVKKLDKTDYDFIANGLISFDDYRNTMQIKSKDNKEIIETLKDLYNFTLLIDDNNILKFMHFFAHFDVDKTNHLIQYKFSERFLQYFTGICRDYFMLSVDEVIGLNSTHAIRIYQLLKTTQNMDKKEFIYTLDEIKKQLNIEKKYDRYNNFKQFVLETSKTQINNSEASQFNIDYEEIKTGKSVTAIKFHLLPKGKNYYQENNLIAGYKIDQITKFCHKWKKEYNAEEVVHLLADKILHELKHKQPKLATVANYLDHIHTITKQQKLL